MGAEFLTGQVLGGQYELRELLGVGGMGAVYRGVQRSLKREVAVKVMPPALAGQQGYAERFNREAETIARLEHPAIVTVFDYGVHDGVSYLVMRLLTGGTLSERLNQRSTSDTPLPSLGETASLVNQLASALHYAHERGIIHRDIKSSNVMFDDQGHPFLVDFGIAKLVDSTAFTGTGMAMGTPQYMPPEQWAGKQLTSAADQYAMGVLTYALVTGRVPFEGTTPYELLTKHIYEQPLPVLDVRPDLPASVNDVLMRSLAKAPEERFESMAAYAEAFSHAIHGYEGAATGFFTFQLPQKTSSGRPYTPLTPMTPRTPTVQGTSTGMAPPQRPRTASVTVPNQLARPSRSLLIYAVAGLMIALLALIAILLATRGPDDSASLVLTQIAALNVQMTETEQLRLAVLALSTDTDTPTPSPTDTVEVTPSRTATPTFTYTPSPTTQNDASPASTPTEPATEQPTEVVAAVVTETATATDTSTPTSTATDTPTLTPTATHTETDTPSPTATDTETPTPTPTDTASPTPTDTDTPTPTPTDTPTDTVTPSPTSTPTDTPTKTPPPTPTPIALAVGFSASGTLTDSQSSQVFEFDGTAGKRVDIHLTSTTADTLVRLLGPDGTLLQENDDQPGTTDSAILNFALPVTGVYTIEATVFSGTGEYRLTLTDAAPPVIIVRRTNTPPPPVASITCPGSLPSRLEVGMSGRVTLAGGRNNVRSTPSVGNIVGQIEQGGEFTVLEGPRCGTGNPRLTWYRVRAGSLEGWTAESDTRDYWLEPLEGTSGSSATPVVTGGECEDAPAQRMRTARFGQMLPDQPARIRVEPGTSAEQIGRLDESGIFAVLDGPQCANGYSWWQIKFMGVIGWAAEGDSSTYFMRPLDNPPAGLTVTTSDRVVYQPFDGGMMLYLEAIGQHIVLWTGNNGPRWRGYLNTFREGKDAESDPSLVPPAGKYQPVRGFGKVWREENNVRERLGWATAPEARQNVTYSYRYGGITTATGQYIDADGVLTITVAGQTYSLNDNGTR